MSASKNLTRSLRLKGADAAGGAVNFNVLDGVALNAAAATRTYEVDLDGDFSSLVVGVYLDRTAATDLVATPSWSNDGGTNYIPFQTQSISSGTVTHSTRTDTTGTISADANLSIELPVQGIHKVRIVFSGTSGGASDLIYVTATAVGVF